MTKEQRKALLESIEHWRRNVELDKVGASINTKASACACCNFSRNEDNFIECINCPIMQYTGEVECYGTPYYRVLVGRAPPEAMYGWLVKLEKGGNPVLDESLY